MGLVRFKKFARTTLKKFKVYFNEFKTAFVHLLFKLTKSKFKYFFDNEVIEEISNNLTIVSTENTLIEIEYFIINKKRGIYLRFGDGDVFLLKNKSDSYQENSESLSIEMKEDFSINGEGVFKCLAIHSDIFGYEKGMEKGNHKNNDFLAKKLVRDTYTYFIGAKIYSPVALHFLSTINVMRANSFLKILKQHTFLFVGNETINSYTLTELFGSKAKHIKTPQKNAYTDIDRVEKEVMDVLNTTTDFMVVCIAMGCSGRPLMKRLWNTNRDIFLFDFGSLLDGILGNNSRTWLRENSINYELLLEGLKEIE